MTRAKKEPIDEDNIKRVLRRVENKNDKQTYQNWRSTYRNFYNFLLEEKGIDDVTEVDHIDIEDYLFNLSEQGYASSSINKSYSALASLFSQLTEWFEVIDENPMERLNHGEYSQILDGVKKKDKTGDEIIYVTEAEVELMVQDAPSPSTRNQLMLKLLYQTGVRASELAGMKVDNVDTESRSIHIKGSKTDEWRYVYYQQNLQQLMSIYLNSFRETLGPAPISDYLFPTYKTEQISPNSVNKMVVKAAENAGIQTTMYEDVNGAKRNRITTHAFRHGHCIMAARSGIDVKRIADHCGHKNIQRTQDYLDYIDEDVREAYHNKFGDVG